MKKPLIATATLALSAGVLSATTVGADAATCPGPVKHLSRCADLGYTKVVTSVDIRNDGLGNKIGELRTMSKTGSNTNQWCNYIKKTGNTVGNDNQVSLYVEILVKTDSVFTSRSRSLTETVKYYSSSFSYMSLSGAAGTSHKTILHTTAGIKSASTSEWYTTAWTLVG